MNESQFDLISFTSDRRSREREAERQSTLSSMESETSLRSDYLEMDDRDLARAIKRIERLSSEIRACEDAEGHVRTMRERIDVARKNAAITVAKLNEKMDSIEQAWDDRIITEQKEIAKEVLCILKDLKEDDLSQALSWRKKKRGRSSRSGKSSSRSTSVSRSQSASSLGSGVSSSSMSRKIAHLDKKEREFAGRAVEVKKDARQIDEMARNLDSINELERVVCSKLSRMQSVGDAKPSSQVYGTVELVDNYRNTVEHLAKAIRSLSSVACLPAITNEDPLTKTEIDKICQAMTEFMGRIKAQLSNGGSKQTSAELTSSRPQTSVRVAGKSRVRPSVTSESAGASVNDDSGGATNSGSGSGSSSISSVAASTAQSIESHRG